MVNNVIKEAGTFFNLLTWQKYVMIWSRWLITHGWSAGVCVVPPDEEVEEEDGTADDSGSTTFLMLWPRQRQPVVHMTLMVHDGLKTDEQKQWSTHAISRHGATLTTHIVHFCPIFTLLLAQRNIRIFIFLYARQSCSSRLWRVLTKAANVHCRNYSVLRGNNESLMM